MLELKCFLVIILRRFVEFCTARKHTIYSFSASQGVSASFFGWMYGNPYHFSQTCGRFLKPYRNSGFFRRISSAGIPCQPMISWSLFAIACFRKPFTSGGGMINCLPKKLRPLALLYLTSCNPLIWFLLFIRRKAISLSRFTHSYLPHSPILYQYVSGFAHYRHSNRGRLWCSRSRVFFT